MQQSNKYKNVKCINLSMSALGIIDNCAYDFLDMLTDLEYDTATKHYIIRKILLSKSKHCISSSADRTKSGRVLNSFLIIIL